MDATTHISYQHQQVLRYIELRTQWEGRITTKHLEDAFGISRDSASKLIKRYNQHSPGNLYYDASAKGHRPTTNFQPIFSTGTLEEYIYSCSQSDLSENPTYIGFADTFPMKQFERTPKPEIVRPILHAISKRKKLDIAYLSMSSPDYEGRIISPHNLIHDGTRWHVRAWCEKNQNYRDFVLSRITDVWGEEGDADRTAKDDPGWNTWLTLTIEPDIRLTPDRKHIVAYDYCMEEQKDGRYQCHYKIRAAFLIYTLRHLGLDRMREKGEAQQVMLTPECQNEIAPYMA